MAEKVQKFNRFEEVAPAAIKPQSFLKEFLVRQKNGLTGNRKELGYPFDTTLWLGKIANVHFTEGIHHGEDHACDPAGAWWPYEQTAYLLDGMARLSLLIDAPEIRKEYIDNLNYLLSHPDKNGMLGHGYHSSDSEWPMAVFFKSVIAWFDATGDKKIKDAFYKHYSALKTEVLGLPGRNMTNIEGVLKTYEWTGDKALLKKAIEAYKLHDKLSIEQDQLHSELNFSSMKSGKRIVMHGVSFAEMLKIPVILYCYTGDKKWLNAAKQCFDKAMEDHEQPSGVPSTNEFLSGHDPIQGFETCCTSDFMWSLGYFVKADGTVRYADRMEKIAYNALPGAITKDFCGLQYLSAVNQLASTPFANASHFNYGASTWRQYKPQHFPQCCPGNVHRAMPDFIMRMWMVNTETGMPAAMLYGPSSFDFKYKGTAVRIDENTGYPFDETISFKFNMKKAAEFAFTFRIPEWCEKASVKLNGKPVKMKLAAGTLAEISRKWSNGDVVELTLPMEVVLKVDRQWGWFERGPLVYSWAVPSTDVREGKGRFAPHNLLPSESWNYAVSMESSTVSQVKVTTAKSAYPFEKPSVFLTVPVSMITGYDALAENRFTPMVPLFHKNIPGSETTLKLQPYGTTLLRVTAFPDTAEREMLPVVLAHAMGPFPYNVHIPLRDQVFPPEYLGSKEFYNSKDATEVQRNPDFYFDLSRHYLESYNKLAYLQFRFWSEKDGLAEFAIAAASCCQCFLNGKPVFESEPTMEAEQMAPLWFQAPVKKGYNFLRVKVAVEGVLGQYRRTAWGAKLEVFYV